MDYWEWYRDRLLFQRWLAKEIKLWDIDDKVWDDKYLDQRD